MFWSICRWLTLAPVVMRIRGFTPTSSHGSIGLPKSFLEPNMVYLLTCGGKECMLNFFIFHFNYSLLVCFQSLFLPLTLAILVNKRHAVWWIIESWSERNANKKWCSKDGNVFIRFIFFLWFTPQPWLHPRRTLHRLPIASRYVILLRYSTNIYFLYFCEGFHATSTTFFSGLK